MAVRGTSTHIERGRGGAQLQYSIQIEDGIQARTGQSGRLDLRMDNNRWNERRRDETGRRGDH